MARVNTEQCQHTRHLTATMRVMLQGDVSPTQTDEMADKVLGQIHKAYNTALEECDTRAPGGRAKPHRPKKQAKAV